jgi:hypothetical protein
VRRLPVTVDAVPSSPILVTLMMEAPRSSETSVLTRATRPNIPDVGIKILRKKVKVIKTHPPPPNLTVPVTC